RKTDKHRSTKRGVVGVSQAGRRAARAEPRPTGPDTVDPQGTQTAAEATAEQAVLGAMLIAPTVIDTVTARISGQDYYQPRHGVIHNAIVAVYLAGRRPDAIAVSRHLTAMGNMRLVAGGDVYLFECIQAVPTAANASYYAALIADHAQRRNLAQIAARLSHAATVEDPARRSELAEAARMELDKATTVTEPAEADTWAPLDLTPALSGGTLTTPPVMLARTDGTNLLYLGRVHSLAGEPEAGKTWVALVGVVQALHDGQHVIYLDFEDTPEGIVNRLLALGAHPQQISAQLHYVRPDRAIDGPARAGLTKLITDHPVTLCVIDGVTEAMTLHGLDPYNNPDAARFYEALPRPLVRLPNSPAVLLIDHVPKDEDRPKRYAIGAQHKLAGLDGAAYVVDIVRPFAPDQPGISRIRVAKDRPGQVRRHATGGVIAELHMGGAYPVVTAELRKPLPSAAATTPD